MDGTVGADAAVDELLVDAAFGPGAEAGAGGTVGADEPPGVDGTVGADAAVDELLVDVAFGPDAEDEAGAGGTVGADEPPGVDGTVGADAEAVDEAGAGGGTVRKSNAPFKSLYASEICFSIESWGRTWYLKYFSANLVLFAVSGTPAVSKNLGATRSAI